MYSFVVISRTSNASLTTLSSSLWVLEGNFSSCIQKIGMLFRIDLANVTLPALDRHSDFEPLSFAFTFWNKPWYASEFLPPWVAWNPKYFPSSLVLGIPKLKASSTAVQFSILREKRTRDLQKLTLWPEALRNSSRSLLMQLAWSSHASMNSKMSS